MLNRKGLAGFAAVCAAAWATTGSLALAGDTSSASDGLSLTTPVLAQAEAPAPRRPLMGLLDQAGLAKGLDDANINIYGWVQGSYTYSFSNPPADSISGRSFDFEHELPILNQAYVVIERTVDVTKGAFDVGGRIDVQWGADARFQHSNGLFDWYSNDGARPLLDQPHEQWDLTQAYLDFAVPVGNGLNIRAGKFSTLAGYEVVPAPGNALYSKGWLFNLGYPFTHTGVLATYVISDQLSIDVGFSRGWDQALEDNNDDLNYMGRVTIKPDEKTAIYITGITGPEQTDNNGRFRTLLNGVVTYAAADNLSFALDSVFGIDSEAAGPDDDAVWYGLGLWSTLTLTDQLALNGRVEAFRDEDGFRGGLGDDQTFYSLTGGLGIKPFANDALGQNLLIRPELRLDYADKAAFDGGTDHYQVTAAVDAVFTF